jgi:Mn2+/Fe2+ NRAMP family transporter
MGLVASALFTHALVHLKYLRLEYEATVDRRFWVTRCLPVGVCHAATLAFGNAQYLYLGLSSIQVLKSFTPIITALVTFCLLGRQESLPSMLALVALCGATASAARGDAHLTLFGAPRP